MSGTLSNPHFHWLAMLGSFDEQAAVDIATRKYEVWRNQSRQDSASVSSGTSERVAVAGGVSPSSPALSLGKTKHLRRLAPWLRGVKH